MSDSQNNKRIAKNTALLYFRMLFMIPVSLYVSRIVLDVLGVEDFGIHSVVGGVVTLFAFFNSAMAAATQRFLAFEMGRGDMVRLQKVFSATLSIHILVSLVVVILAESVGLWFFYEYLNIPENRLDAAFWVYQLSVATFVVKMLQVPYNASVIANERMNIYAYVSILEVLLILSVVFILKWIEFDKLVLYGILLLLVSLVITTVYRIYCKRNLAGCHYSFEWDKPLYKELASYSGWNLFGNLAFVANGQGVNILLNIFFGPAINAARAIAFQVQAAVQSFVGNFQMAVNPQIIKSYAASELHRMKDLVFRSARISFFLLFFLSLPILLETEFILNLWLKTVPAYASLFTALIVINALIDCFSGALRTSAQATGRIKWYQIIVGGMLLLNLPISWLFLELGYPPETTIYISISLSVIALILRLVIIERLLEFSARYFLIHVFLKSIFIALIAGVVPYLVLYNLESSWMRFMLVCITSAISVISIVFLIGLSKGERQFLLQVPKSVLNRKK